MFGLFQKKSTDVPARRGSRARHAIKKQQAVPKPTGIYVVKLHLTY
jgi:hypothetical protein